ncbi:DUF1266 domain-containing protein [Salinivibrio sp. ES.052]|uniref:DUF1266 domain-containing protein n=1 Tax=Salinivibrio sp. ES.052 TaxID=1882823 RepID=UPI00092AF4C8|nr:DUF1266 domain-containing protein [Salinivibrio sp. ES.052]SIN79942.1 Protein of unknown function [Salinivibrio sp. ES.052]
MRASENVSYKDWLLTLGAPHTSIFEGERKYLDPYWVNSKECCYQILERDWGIEERASLYHQIHSLVYEGTHGHFLSHLYAKYASSTAHEWSIFALGFSPSREKAEIDFVSITYDILGLGGTRGYDYGRACFLAREGLKVDWLSEDEFYYIHSIIARKAKFFYKSWQQYTHSWILGSCYWAYLVNDLNEEETCDIFLNQGLRNRLKNRLKFSFHDNENPIHWMPWDGVYLPEMETPDSLKPLIESEEYNESV